jgi:hypothetical protein
MLCALRCSLLLAGLFIASPASGQNVIDQSQPNA